MNVVFENVINKKLAQPLPKRVDRQRNSTHILLEARSWLTRFPTLGITDALRLAEPRECNGRKHAARRLMLAGGCIASAIANHRRIATAH